MPCSNKARDWAGGPGGGGGGAGESAGAANADCERVGVLGGVFAAAFVANGFPEGLADFPGAFFFALVVAMRRGEKYQKLELRSRRLAVLLFSQDNRLLDDLLDVRHASSKSHGHQLHGRVSSESRS